MSFSPLFSCLVNKYVLVSVQIRQFILTYKFTVFWTWDLKCVWIILHARYEGHRYPFNYSAGVIAKKSVNSYTNVLTNNKGKMITHYMYNLFTMSV